MSLLDKPDESARRVEEAKQYSNPYKKEFDLDTAISLLEEAVTLRSDKEQYSQKLVEIRELKAKTSLKFSMRAWDARAVTLLDGEPGTAVSGIVEQGTIRNGDEVKIRRGRQGHFKDKSNPRRGNCCNRTHRPYTAEFRPDRGP